MSMISLNNRTKTKRVGINSFAIIFELFQGFQMVFKIISYEVKQLNRLSISFLLANDCSADFSVE